MEEISPLFALEAEQLLLSGFLEEAIELCNSGLSVYPDYPIANVILARAYFLLGNNQLSEDILKKAKLESYGKVLDKVILQDIEFVGNENITSNSDDIIFAATDKTTPDSNDNYVANDSLKQSDLIKFNDDFEQMLNSILDTQPNISEEVKHINNDNNIKPIINEVKQTDKNKIQTIIEEKNKTADTTKAKNILSKNKDFFFQRLDVNKQIESIEKKINTSINGKNELKNNFDEISKFNLHSQSSLNNSLRVDVMNLISTRYIKDKKADAKPEEKEVDLTVYTETMAKIFTAQGAKDKAINIYRKLILKEPEKEKYYNTQIQKIR